jgi:hypothetical protein
MTSKQRLLASLRGWPVDRPAVNFYEVGGMRMNPDDPDPFNVHNDPSWRPLLELAEEQTDLIRMRGPGVTFRHPELRGKFFQEQQWVKDGVCWMRSELNVGKRRLTQLQRRDAAIDTVWTVEYWLRSERDVQAFLELPDEVLAWEANWAHLQEESQMLGERGLVMIDTPDPLCQAAGMMSMEDYTVLAFTDPSLFHALLSKLAVPLQEATKTVAGACPGFLWRIYGPEYASEPYLPPRLFEEYVVSYTGPMVKTIHQSGGYARIHCHGRLGNILPFIVQMGAAAIDPIEPPPQGDVELIDVRREYGQALTLFGNLEASDIENLPADEFERRVVRALREGTAGKGRGFVLMPSACPYGRVIGVQTLVNYETMVRLAHAF